MAQEGGPVGGMLGVGRGHAWVARGSQRVALWGCPLVGPVGAKPPTTGHIHMIRLAQTPMVSHF